MRGVGFAPLLIVARFAGGGGGFRKNFVALEPRDACREHAGFLWQFAGHQRLRRRRGPAQIRALLDFVQALQQLGLGCFNRLRYGYGPAVCRVQVFDLQPETNPQPVTLEPQPLHIVVFGFVADADNRRPQRLVHRIFLVQHVSQSDGTSFAAPRIAGYVAIVRSKFPNLNASQTASIMLDTARYDTLACSKSAQGCDKAIYGKGEASLSRALAPVGKLR